MTATSIHRVAGLFWPLRTSPLAQKLCTSRNLELQCIPRVFTVLQKPSFIMLASDLEYSVAMGDDEEQSQTDTPSLNFVWSVFKESGTSAKLILPDLLSNPFYLPSPRATKADKDAKFEREMRRFDYLCARDSKFVAPSDRRSILNLLPNYDLRGRER